MGSRKIREIPSGAYAVTPSDGSDLPNGPCLGLWIGTAGNGTLTVIPADQVDDTPVTFTSVETGQFVLRIKRVLATGTGASNIIAMY